MIHWPRPILKCLCIAQHATRDDTRSLLAPASKYTGTPLPSSLVPWFISITNAIYAYLTAWHAVRVFIGKCDVLYAGLREQVQECRERLHRAGEAMIPFWCHQFVQKLTTAPCPDSWRLEEANQVAAEQDELRHWFTRARLSGSTVRRLKTDRNRTTDKSTRGTRCPELSGIVCQRSQASRLHASFHITCVADLREISPKQATPSNAACLRHLLRHATKCWVCLCCAHVYPQRAQVEEFVGTHSLKPRRKNRLLDALAWLREHHGTSSVGPRRPPNFEKSSRHGNMGGTGGGHKGGERLRC